MAQIGAIRCESTREEARAELLSPDKYKERTVEGRREKSLLCDPGSELRPLIVNTRDREKKGEYNKWNGTKENIAK